jgi:catechol 2,3-dioxygenase-like lactoylglutathione lyase family enzyme
MATVRYMVTDVDQAVDFYTQRLGFSLTKSWAPAIAMVSRGDLTVWLSGPPSSAARPMPDGRTPEPGGWNRLVIETDDIHGMVNRLKEAGVTFRNEVISGPGGSQVLIEDPSGNPIELFQAAQ